MEDVRGLVPRSRVAGSFRPPGSKSIAQRALVAALLCPEPSEIGGLPDGADVRAALRFLTDAGARVERLDPASVRVTGPGAGDLGAEGVLTAGESGTLARFATAALALCRRSQAPVVVRGRGTLVGRGSAPLFDALRGAGAELTELEPPSGWPVRIKSTLAPGEVMLVDPVSSQELSALWIAAAAQPGPMRVLVEGRVPSTPYLEITYRVLTHFGVRLEAVDGGCVVTGPLRAPALVIEADASSGAAALAAGCLSGGEVRVLGIPATSAQGDARIAEHLAAFGCDARREGDDLVASGFPAHGARLDLVGEPDLAPVLAVIAAGAALQHGVASRLGGLGTLPGKESDRLAVLADGLRRCGLTVAAGPDALEIAPGAKPDPDERLVLDPAGDHRMAFAFALLGLLVPNVLVATPRCVTKSWPRFWEDLEALGAVVVRG